MYHAEVGLRTGRTVQIHCDFTVCHFPSCHTRTLSGKSRLLLFRPKKLWNLSLIVADGQTWRLKALELWPLAESERCRVGTLPSHSLTSMVCRFYSHQNGFFFNSARIFLIGKDDFTLHQLISSVGIFLKPYCGRLSCSLSSPSPESHQSLSRIVL